ncbi:MAG: response regulator [Planctomycetota bacterium]|nr:response regulator [Planctomycetota bacterium]
MLRKPKILIVDDNDLLRQMLVDMLTADYCVSCVASGREMFHLLKEEHDYDLVIADISMPGGDGDEIMAKVHALGRNTPVLFMSGVSGLDIEVDLPKPFSRDELIAAIRRALVARTG